MPLSPGQKKILRSVTQEIERAVFRKSSPLDQRVAVGATLYSYIESMVLCGHLDGTAWTVAGGKDIRCGAAKLTFMPLLDDDGRRLWEIYSVAKRSEHNVSELMRWMRM
jgi:hypothetical protein